MVKPMLTNNLVQDVFNQHLLLRVCVCVGGGEAKDPEVSHLFTVYVYQYVGLIRI